VLEALFRSRLRAKLIAHLFANAGKSFFARQLEGLLGENQGNISRELHRLAALGVVSVEREGRQKFYKASEQCPIFAELCGIAVKTAGLADVLRAALRPLKSRIATAFVYGSMASGDVRAESDVDLLVVGDVDEMALHRAASKAEARLARTVNYTLLSRKEFARRRRERSGFLARVLAGEKIPVLGDPGEPG